MVDSVFVIVASNGEIHITKIVYRNDEKDCYNRKQIPMVSY